MPLPVVVRRVRLYKLLCTGVPFAVEDLARMLCVGRGTIRRDLATLVNTGEPVEMARCNGRRLVRIRKNTLEPRGIRC